MGEATFQVSLRQRPGVLDPAKAITLTAVLDTPATLKTSASVRVEDEPLKDVPMVQAEDFAAQTGGQVQIREDKVGAVGKSFSHWDAQGHALTWKITVPASPQAPADGEYRLVVRYCATNDVQREVVVDSSPPITAGSGRSARFPSTGGFSSTANDWSHAAVLGADGKPLVLRLCAGEHTIKLTNVDGQGMNLDYLALVR